MFDRFTERCAALAAIAGTLSLCGTASAVPRPWQPIPRFEVHCSSAEASAELDRAVSAHGPRDPGVALALLRDGQPPAVRYSGMESLESGTPVGPETRFYIASLAKTMTATAALMLRDRGRLRLEDPLARWIDGIPACARDVRLIHLLQHTSGLPDHFKALGEKATGVDNARVLAFVRGLDSLEFQPGEDYAYSNTGYVLLAEVIGKASGVGYVAFVQDSIFRPLGMTATAFVRKGMPSIEHRALGYHREGNRFIPDDLRDHWTLGGGGVYSTLANVMTWHRAVMESRLLKPSSTALLFETPVTLSGRKSYLGMGWSDETPGRRTPEIEGLRAYGSFGELAGFRSAILFYPDYGVTWIALSNSGEGALPPKGMVERLFRRIP